MPIKLHVMLFNKKSPFHWARQHVAAMAVDMCSGRSFDLEFVKFKTNAFEIYKDEEANPFYQFLTNTNCNLGIATVYGEMDFDKFVEEIKKEFSDTKTYNCGTKNCADVVKYALDLLCPQKQCLDASFILYRITCFPIFLATLGASCFPALGITTPQDIFDKAKALAGTPEYGKPKEPAKEEKDNSYSIR